MKIPVIFSKLGGIAKNAAGTTGLLAKKHAPEIMLTFGFVGFIATIVETVKATNETNEILEYKETKMALIQQESAENPTYTNDIRVMDEKNLIRNTRIALVKAWWKVGAGVIFVFLNVGGAYKIINGRLVAVTVAYEGAQDFISRYRKNVVDEFGKEVDWRMANSIKAEEFEADRKERARLYEAKKEGKKPRTKYSREASSQIFDQYSDRWRSYWNPQQVWDYLITVEDQLNDELRIRKHIFENDVWKRLGLPITKQGQVLGWYYSKDHPTRISLGLREMPQEVVRDFLSETINENIWIRLHLNPDGNILGLIEPQELLPNVD